jgi:hypothetical protein
MTEKHKGNLMQAVEGDFARESRAEHDALRKELEEAASQNTAPVEIYGGGMFMIVLMLAVGVFGLGGAVRGGDSMGQIIFCLVVAVLFLGYGTLTLLKWNKPAMILTADGILFSGMEKPLPWADISGCSVEYTGVLFLKTSANIYIHLDDGVAKPALSGDFRVRYLPAVPRLNAGHRISIRLLSIRGISEERFDEIFSAYAHSGKARAALKAM